ncbi:EGF-like domain-containing protein 2 [Haliotis rubra]|uniref:EGF-like domain-containing protein 2 n=1 Tax=Haliotis rubra TaxID=36100 RepID=UPI001EE61ED7|nr:EGF-like domain-containing protein 2 [Haliotis rubra]XP_046574912.1 EGF-like domain-containing protein 2 [Haliotis rubra]
MRFAAVVGCVLALVLVSDAYFDCRRRGMSCNGGACDPITGSCICINNSTAKDCGLGPETTGCVGECQNDGTCTDILGPPSCYCNETFTGPLCELRRSQVECSGENMTITIRPYTGFVGRVYIRDQANNDQCAFEEKTDEATPYYQQIYNLREDCSAIVKNDTPGVGDVTFQREVIVQYNPNLETRIDQIITISCEHIAANTSDLDSTMPSVDVDQRTNLTRDDTKSVYEPVEFEIQERTGGKVTPPVFIGRELRLFFSLKDTAVFKTLNVESCMAVNGLTGSNRKTQNLVQNSCPTIESFEVLRGPPARNSDQTAVVINFDAFKFVDSHELEFECKIRTCKEGDTRCEPETCFGAETGFGRKKRDTGSRMLDDDETVMRRRITVIDPHSSQIITGSPNKSKECIQRIEIIVTIAILAAAVFILFIVTLCLALRALRSRAKTSASSDTDSTTSSDGTRLRIPRVRSVF